MERDHRAERGLGGGLIRPDGVLQHLDIPQVVQIRLTSLKFDEMIESGNAKAKLDELVRFTRSLS